MAISMSLRQYLDDHQIHYDVIQHRRTNTAYDTARTTHVPVERMVKGVLLQDKFGYLLAAIPANTEVDLEWVEIKTGRQMALADENDLAIIFSDCDFGAVPALGEAFGLNTLWDEQLMMEPEYYLEAGDHEELIHLNHYQYIELLDENNCGPIAH